MTSRSILCIPLTSPRQWVHNGTGKFIAKTTKQFYLLLTIHRFSSASICYQISVLLQLACRAHLKTPVVLHRPETTKTSNNICTRENVAGLTFENDSSLAASSNETTKLSQKDKSINGSCSKGAQSSQSRCTRAYTTVPIIAPHVHENTCVMDCL